MVGSEPLLGGEGDKALAKPPSLTKRCEELFRWNCLSSGEPPDDQDPFKYSKSEYHEIGHSRQSKHGSRPLKMLDELCAVLLIGGLVGGKTIVVAADVLWLLLGIDFTSMQAVRLANDIIEWAIVLGVGLMWWTLCQWSEWLHKFWKRKFWGVAGFMPGGFMPRLASLSVGILMFTTSTLVSEGRVAGKDLFKSGHWELCRGTDMEADGSEDRWFGRILRRPPAVLEKDSEFRCFKTHLKEFGGGFKSADFNITDLHDKFDRSGGKDEAEKKGVEIPYNGSVALNNSHGFPLTWIVPLAKRLGLADDSDFPLFSFHCMYQCSKWKSVGLMAVIGKVGTIAAGSTIVVKTAETISTNFGGHLWGCTLVTQDTHSKDVMAIIKATRSRPGKGRSKFFAALACLACMGPLRLASKIDNDGYYTVDYYVTAVFLSSVLMACMVRQFNPYKMMRMAYTKNMWLHGEDSFIDLKKHEYRKLDLYEWIHLTQQARGDHLFNYARMVTVKDIDEELSMRKDIRSYEAKPDEATDEEKTAVAKHYEDCKKAPINEYYNEHASRVVKVIKDISCITTSPPLPTEAGDDVKAGSTVLKTVTIRRDAVGTVVEKLDGERIKVRFPREVPASAPLSHKSLKKIAIIKKTLEDGAVINAPLMTKRKDEEGKEIDALVIASYCPKSQTVKPAPEKYDTTALESWSKVDEKDIRNLRQYTMTLTPSPKDKESRKKMNCWLHNALVDVLNPRPHHPDKMEDDEHKNQKKKGSEDVWEDVIVPLHQVLEVSEKWNKIEEERFEWHESVYLPAKTEEEGMP